ncbi:MAG: 50S ribosomal protein L10 [Clostridiales bacterium]|nr:50S ribosomal protein L10 [Clostridiales bacterium]
MPSQKILDEKKKLVSDLVSDYQKAQSFVFANARGMKVSDDTEMRAELRKNNVSYKVIKNSIARRVFQGLEIDGVQDIFKGPTAIAYSTEDPIAPAKVLKQYADKINELNIKGGIIEGKVASIEEVNTLAKIPAQEVLYGQIAYGLLFPFTKLAMLLKAAAEKIEQEGPIDFEANAKEKKASEKKEAEKTEAKEEPVAEKAEVKAEETPAEKKEAKAESKEETVAEKAEAKAEETTAEKKEAKAESKEETVADKAKTETKATTAKAPAKAKTGTKAATAKAPAKTKTETKAKATKTTDAKSSGEAKAKTTKAPAKAKTETKATTAKAPAKAKTEKPAAETKPVKKAAKPTEKKTQKADDK